MTLEPKTLLTRAYEAAVRAAQPGEVLRPHLPELPKGRLVVVGAGKAAASMANAAEAHYPLEKLEGLVVTRYGHALPTRKIEVLEAAHPVPDGAGVQATERILETASNLGEDDLLLCLLSGGGSALLCAPLGVTLPEKAELTGALLASGADIAEINTVRKHLSAIKGGRLAAAAHPAPVVSLILSDVVGDELSSIASGPTAPDPTTFGEALEVLDRYAIVAPAARRVLERGVQGELPETPKPGDACFAHVQNLIIASAQQSLEAAARVFEAVGIPAHILGDSVTGEAREVAKAHAAMARQVARYGQPFARPCALLSGGETTVTIRQPGGRGGRNSEFALSLALELADLKNVYALAADTDGIDGSEENAGAFVLPGDVMRLGKDRARGWLEGNDSYGFFERAGALFTTGPTRTNVNDLRMILVL